MFTQDKLLSADVGLKNSRRDGSASTGPSLAVAVAEHHLLSRCDWTVTTESSGFSKTAVFASLAEEDSEGNKHRQHYKLQTTELDRGDGALQKCDLIDLEAHARTFAHI